MSRTRGEPFEAVVADMDGVLTRTASLHQRAWKRMFDDYLRERREKHGETHAPFSSADYRAHVDGKPRYDGVRDFLAARGVVLPRGQSSDAATVETVCGLGNRKNEIFLALLDRGGAKVFRDAADAVARWRRGGLKLAVVSSSRNCRRVLRATGLDLQFEVIVDGQLGDELGLEGKRGLMEEAVRRLAVAPADAVVLEDATAGVRAAREARFGCVVGVSRNEHERDLRAAGADVVVRSVYRARFLRRLPSAFDRMDELRRWQADRALALLLDYDGTLAPIVSDPQEANMTAEMRSTVEALARSFSVAIISGRDREDVERRVDIPGLMYAGNHGFDIAGRGHARTLPEAADALGDVSRAEHLLRKHLEPLSGVIIERKRFSVAAHYRRVADEAAISHVMKTVDAVRDETRLRLRSGKKVLELEPAVDWDKGYAARWLMDVLGLDEATSFVVYVGDDETDEDAFAAIEGRGAGVRVGDEVTSSLGDYRVTDPDEVRDLLRRLTGEAPA